MLFYLTIFILLLQQSLLFSISIFLSTVFISYNLESVTPVLISTRTLLLFEVSVLIFL